MKKLLRRIIGRLLHIANSDPGWSRRDFYAMKERILNRYGTQGGYYLQEIPAKPCWTCDGSGWYAAGDKCRRCGGSGIYSTPVWVVLEQWELGGYHFHRPTIRHYTKPSFMETTIHGYVEHADYGVRDKTAMLWLALVFDRRLWWREMTSSRYCGFQWRPMLMLNWLLMEAWMRWADWKRRCHCGRHTWGSTTFVCKKCRDEPRELQELPF